MFVLYFFIPWLDLIFFGSVMFINICVWSCWHSNQKFNFVLALCFIYLFWDGVSLCPGLWSAVVWSRLTTPPHQVQAILHRASTGSWDYRHLPHASRLKCVFLVRDCGFIIFNTCWIQPDLMVTCLNHGAGI